MRLTSDEIRTLLDNDEDVESLIISRWLKNLEPLMNRLDEEDRAELEKVLHGDPSKSEPLGVLHAESTGIRIVGPPYFSDDEVCGYCGRQPGQKHTNGCRQ